MFRQSCLQSADCISFTFPLAHLWNLEIKVNLPAISSLGLILIRALPPESQSLNAHLPTSSPVIPISEPDKINYCMFLFHERVRVR